MSKANFNDLFQVCIAKFFLNLTFISHSHKLMKKLNILFIAKTFLSTVQKKDISIKEIGKTSFRTEYMNAMSGKLNFWILKFTSFEANKPFDQVIYQEKPMEFT
tara:strand:- start:324 stop:635 length:312 start_codon:yes stop_codon:yes gene_type:complete